MTFIEDSGYFLGFVGIPDIMVYLLYLCCHFYLFEAEAIHLRVQVKKWG